MKETELNYYCHQFFKLDQLEIKIVVLFHIVNINTYINY